MPNYIPEFSGYSGQGAFRYWCQKVLPLVYDDSLSYYELLNKMVVYLNNTIEDVAKAEGNIDSLLTAYTQLQGYVNDYFDNLDVQEQINTKLDAMAESGELSDLLEPFIPALVTSWLTENVIIPTGGVVTLDPTLTSAVQAAQAKTVGDTFNTTIRMKRALTADDIITESEGVTRTVTETGYYYITTAQVGNTLFGVPSPGVFIIFRTATLGTIQQLAIFNNGIVLVRYGATTEFTRINISVDNTLSISGAAADAKVTGDRFDTTITSINSKQDKQYKFTNDSHLSYIETHPTTGDSGRSYLYDYQTNTYIPLSTTLNYITSKFEITPNMKLKITGVQGHDRYRLYTILDKNGNIIDASPTSITGAGLKEQIITTPQNSAYIWVNGVDEEGLYPTIYVGTYIENIISYIDENINSSKKFKVKLNITSDKKIIEVTDGNFVFKWGNNGANNLPNLISYSYNGNIFFNGSTDWIGPYDFDAVTVSDITGTRNDPNISQYITSTNTTGGNHAFIYNDGTDEINYRSAKNNSLDFYFDNKKSEYSEVGTYEIECDNIKAVWCNDVCAGNTVQINPDNPTVLKGETPITEYGYADFIGNGKINVGVTFKINAPIQMKWYSGLQIVLSGITGESRSFYSPDISNEMMPYDTPFSDYSVENKVSILDFIGNNLSIRMCMDRNYGLGKNILSTKYVSWSTTKAYMNLFDKRSETPTSYDVLNDGVYSWVGYYKFYPTNLNQLLPE